MATVRLPLATSPTGAFGLEYNDANGRVSRVYCTDARGVRGRVILAGGQIVEQALTAGQTMPVPGTSVRVLPATDDEGHAGWTLEGVESLSFAWGA